MKRLQTSDPPRTERRRGPDLTQRAPRGPREPRVGSAAGASAVPEGPASERRWPGDPGPRHPPDPKPRELWHLWGSCYRGTCTFKLSCMPCIVSQSGNKDFIKTQRPCDQEAGRRRSCEVCFPPPTAPHLARRAGCPPLKGQGCLPATRRRGVSVTSSWALKETLPKFPTRDQLRWEGRKVLGNRRSRRGRGASAQSPHEDEPA